MGKLEAVLEVLATGTNLAAIARKEGFRGVMKAAPAIIKEDGPNIFGLGFDDETLWLDANRKAEALRRGNFAKITALARVMNDYEDYFLRMVVTNAKLPTEVKKAGDQTVVTYTTDPNQDPRVQALLFIGGLFDEETPGETVRRRARVAQEDLHLNEILQMPLFTEDSDVLIRIKEVVDNLPENHPLYIRAEKVKRALRDHHLVRGQSKFMSTWQRLVKWYEELVGGTDKLADKLEKLREDRREKVGKPRKSETKPSPKLNWFERLFR